MGRLRNYEPIDPQEVEKAEGELYSGGTQTVKLREGRNVLRFLPRKKGTKTHVITVHRHYVENVPGRDNTLIFNCPRKMLRPAKECPECAEWQRLMQSNNPVDQAQADEHKPRSTMVANVIDRSREADGPLLFYYSSTIKDGLKEIQENDGDYTNPEDDGFDVVIVRRGTGMKTKYPTIQATRESLPLSEDLDEAEDWIENQWPLDEQKVCLSASAIRRALEGGDMRRADRQLPRGRGRNSDYDDDEAEEARRGYRRKRDPDDDETEGDRPSRRRNRRSRAEDSPHIPPARGRRNRRRNIQDDVERDGDNGDETDDFLAYGD